MNNFEEKIQNADFSSLPQIKTERVPTMSLSRIRRKVKYGLSETETAAAHERTVKPTKRVFAVAVAVALIICASATVYAYREVITETVKHIFTREEALIDEKAAHIDTSVTENNVTLTVDKAVRDDGTWYFYLKLGNNGGFFEGTAMGYDKLTLERRTVDKNGNSVYEPVTTEIMNRDGLYAGDVMCVIPDEKASDINLIIPFKSDGGGEYRLSVENLYSVCNTTDENGKAILNYTDYTELLSVDFSLEDVAQDIEVMELEPNSEIIIDGYTFSLDKIRVSPIEIYVSISYTGDEKVTLYGYDFSPLGYLTSFIDPDGIDMFDFDDPVRNAFHELYIENNLDKYSYKLLVDIKDNVSAVDKYNSYTSFGGYHAPSEGEGINYTMKLTSPVYFSDVERLYLQSLDGENEKIVIWENAAAEEPTPDYSKQNSASAFTTPY